MLSRKELQLCDTYPEVEHCCVLVLGEGFWEGHVGYYKQRVGCISLLHVIGLVFGADHCAVLFSAANNQPIA